MVRYSTTSRRNRAATGFTLVEILAVLVIIGIASAVIVPQLGNRDDLIVASASRVVMSDLIYAQNLAISRQSPVYVRFYTSAEVDGNKYAVLSACSPDVMLSHPVEKDDFLVRFGDVAGSRFDTVEIDSARFNGVDLAYVDEFTIGFDELGTPRVFCYDPMVGGFNELGEGGTTSADHGIILSSGSNRMRITIERYTGEIGVETLP